MTSVLYDQPGPRSRRRILVGSVVSVLGLLALAALVVARLADNGQFEGERWSSLLDPRDERFGRVWEILGGAVVNTLQAAGLAIVASLVVGTLLAVLRLSLGPIARLPVVGLIELLRGVPVVLMIFFVWRFGVDGELGFDLIWYLVIGLTLYNSVVVAEIVRAGVNALPRGQREAALAVGLSRGQAMRLVLLPQAFRIMLPALISQLVVILKDTSLGFVILYPETVNEGQRLVQTLENPLQMYAVLGVLFIVVNTLLGRLAQVVERRVSGGAAGRVRAMTPAATGE